MKSTFTTRRDGRPVEATPTTRVEADGDSGRHSATSHGVASRRVPAALAANVASTHIT